MAILSDYYSRQQLISGENDMKDWSMHRYVKAKKKKKENKSLVLFHKQKSIILSVLIINILCEKYHAS